MQIKKAGGAKIGACWAIVVLTLTVKCVVSNVWVFFG